MSDKSRQEDEIEVLESIYDKDLIISSKWPSSGCLLISPDPVFEEMNMNVVSVVNDTSVDKTIKLRYLLPIELYFVCPKDYPSKSQPLFMLKCIWLPEPALSAICRKLDAMWDYSRSEILYDWAYFLKECCSFLNVEKLNFTTNVNESNVNTRVPCHDIKQPAGLKLKELPNKLQENSCDDDEVNFDVRVGRRKVRRTRERRLRKNFKYETPKDMKMLDRENRQRAEKANAAGDVYSSSSLSAHSRGSSSRSIFSSTFEYILATMTTYGVRRKIICQEYDSRVISNNEETDADEHNTRGVSLIIQKLIDYNEECIGRIFRNESHFCSICLEQKQGSQSVRVQPCGHVFCQVCVAQYLSINITNGNVGGLRCPNVDCETSFSAAQIRQNVDDTIYRKFEEFAQKAAVENDPNLLYCPRQVCQSIARRCPELGLELCHCSRCSFYFCSYCKKAYHGVQACQLQDEERKQVIREYLNANSAHQLVLEKRYTKTQIRKWVDEYLTTEWIEEKSKPCPNCKVPIQKNSGCNKMLCFNCNIPFCWLCHKCLSRLGPYDHFNNPESPCYQQLFPFQESDEQSDFEGEDFWEDELFDDY